MSTKKPTLEDLCRMVCSVKARLAKELIGLSVTIQTFPMDPPKPRPEKDQPIEIKIRRSGRGR